MITLQKIIDAINTVLLQKHPECTFYIQSIPQGFERPSFYIKVINSSDSDNNYALLNEEVSIEIVYFTKVDAYYNSDQSDILKVCDELRSIFSPGYLRVDDRALKITDKSLESRENEIYMTLDFEYVDDKTKTDPNYDLMRKVNIK